MKYERRNENIITRGNNMPEYTAITENNAIKSSIGPIDVNDCITACFNDISFMNKTGNVIYYKYIFFTKWHPLPTIVKRFLL